MPTYFSDFFKVSPSVVEDYGAVNISLVTDLPLFIDPFLLFNSKEGKYQKLHKSMIDYLLFLREQSDEGGVNDGLLQAWYCFKEIKQTWLGFSKTGNQGHGLGMDFARALDKNLGKIFQGTAKNRVARANHLEKVSLIRGGVGRDNVSDFTTNLIKDFLCTYTQEFALARIKPKQRKLVRVPKAVFNYETKSWATREYVLPWINGDYVILTPKNLLTRDEHWINNQDLYDNFSDIPASISDAELRSQVNEYFYQALHTRPDHKPTKEERHQAVEETLKKFPELVDYFIKLKEAKGAKAVEISSARVAEAVKIFIEQTGLLQKVLESNTKFYQLSGNTYNESHQRAAYLKDVIENKGGHRIFYIGGEPIRREEDLQILYRLVWFGTPSDVTREANDGRGPADFKISRGAKDKTIVEMKLARNSQLKKNLQKQAEIYQKASDAKHAIKIILYFSPYEKAKAENILKELGLDKSRDVILIDAQDGNKPSGSKA